MQRQLDGLRREVEESRGLRDPFCAFLYRARRDLRRAGLNDRKSGKNTQHFLEQSYRQAERFGFRGSLREWAVLLRTGSEWIGEG